MLNDLREWFGTPESTEEYITDPPYKTVQSGHYDEYDVTNKLYKLVGCKELEVVLRVVMLPAVAGPCREPVPRSCPLG